MPTINLGSWRNTQQTKVLIRETCINVYISIGYMNAYLHFTETAALVRSSVWKLCSLLTHRKSPLFAQRRSAGTNENSRRSSMTSGGVKRCDVEAAQAHSLRSQQRDVPELGRVPPPCAPRGPVPVPLTLLLLLRARCRGLIGMYGGRAELSRAIYKTGLLPSGYINNS